MDGLEGAAHGQGLAQFFQRQVGFAGHEFPQPVLVALAQHGLAAAVAVAGTQIAGVTTLLEELLDQTERDLEAVGDLLAGALLLIIGGQDAFPQVQGDGFSHDRTLAQPLKNGYSII